jgi:5-methylcytosine-specific restriction enzyme subunit McrC
MRQEIKILKVQERGSVSVPLNVLVDVDGKLKFNRAIDRGLVEIRQGVSELYLKIGAVVGRLPLTAGYALDVAPKFPMSNLTRLLALSEEGFSKRADIFRLYEKSSPDGFVPELLVRSLAEHLHKASTEGYHREYLKQVKLTSIRPRINFGKSSQNCWARGQYTKAVTEQFQYTYDNLENQLLKLGCHVALAHCKNNKSANLDLPIISHTLSDLNAVSIKSPDVLLSDYAHRGSRIPTFKNGINKAVEISVELILRTGIVFDGFDEGIELPSFLINLDNVFEAYIRNVLRNGLSNLKSTAFVRDGNQKAWQKPFFDDTGAGLAKPDLLFFEGSKKQPCIIGDVKYKREIAVEDRYQVISHALSHSCNTAILVAPAESAQKAGLVRVGKLGPQGNEIELYEFRFDLEGTMANSEEALVRSISQLAEAKN